MQTKTLGAHVRELRRGKRWTLRALAEVSGLSVSHLSRIENDAVSPNAESVMRLATALDSDVFEMLSMSGALPAGARGRGEGPPTELRSSATPGDEAGTVETALAVREAIDALVEAVARIEAVTRRLSTAMAAASAPPDVIQPGPRHRLDVIVEAPASVEEVAELQQQLLSLRGVTSVRIRSYSIEAAAMELTCAGAPLFSNVSGWVMEAGSSTSASHVVARRA